MPINLKIDPQANIGKIILRWQFQDFKPVYRSRTWWVVMGLIAGGLVVWSVLSWNFLFALIIIIGAIILVSESQREPRRLECKITTLGVAVGKKFWRWSELAEFWIAYHPPQVTNLYLVPKNPFDPRVRVPLVRTNPLEVRKLLSNNVTEDLTREDEPTSEALSHLLKLQ